MFEPSKRRKQRTKQMAHWQMEVNPVRNENEAAQILIAAATEWNTVKEGSRAKKNGFNIRIRNKLMSNAGYAYIEAYYVVQDIMKL